MIIFNVPGGWKATFNKRHLEIKQNKRGIEAIDITTGESIHGDELRSITNLLRWHIESKRESSELPTIATVR